MSTLAEIEAAVEALTLDELRRLEGLLHSLTRERAGAPHTFTGREAIDWWRETERLGAEEADSFAIDLESARAKVGAPLSRWD